jgi:hypothetical protein
LEKGDASLYFVPRILQALAARLCSSAQIRLLEEEIEAMRARPLKPGDLYEIKTKDGFSYFQYTHKNQLMGPLIWNYGDSALFT